MKNNTEKCNKQIDGKSSETISNGEKSFEGGSFKFMWGATPSITQINKGMSAHEKERNAKCDW